MPANPFNWSDHIKKAKEDTNSFEPLQPGVFNFRIVKPEIRTWDNGDQSINYRATVVDGPRANAIHFDNLNPFSDLSFAVKSFLDLVLAVGYNHDWLIQHNPSIEQIASALEGREFSAELYPDKNGKTDNKGRVRHYLRNYKPKAGAAPSAPAQPQPSQAPQSEPNPWGNDVPTPDQFSAQQPAQPPQQASSSGAPANPWA